MIPEIAINGIVLDEWCSLAVKVAIEQWHATMCKDEKRMMEVGIAAAGKDPGMVLLYKDLLSKVIEKMKQTPDAA